MKKIAAALISAAMLCAMLAAPALAWEHEDHRAWQGRDGQHEYYRGDEHPRPEEDRPRWASNNGNELREHHDWNNSWYRGDRDYHWYDPDGWYHRDDDR